MNQQSKKVENNFVDLDEFGIPNQNYYWHNYESMGLSKEDIFSACLTEHKVLVHEDIVGHLIDADEAIQDMLGYRLYIREGYRPKELYEVVYQRRVEKFGKEVTDSLLNMNDMPHSTGKSVDAVLWDEKTEGRVHMHDGKDGTNALHVDFYKNKEGEDAQHYQQLQEIVIDTMQKQGFRLGEKREYFHFDYKPETEKKY